MSQDLVVPVDPMKSFQEKLEARVREDIADLLPEEAVNELVKRAVEETFFKPRKVMDNSGWNSRTVEAPSWFVTEVTKAAGPILKTIVDDFVQENKPVIEKAIADYLTPQNLTLVATHAMTQEISAGIRFLTSTLQDMAQRRS